MVINEFVANRAKVILWSVDSRFYDAKRRYFRRYYDAIGRYFIEYYI